MDCFIFNNLQKKLVKLLMQSKLQPTAIIRKKYLANPIEVFFWRNYQELSPKKIQNTLSSK